VVMGNPGLLQELPDIPSLLSEGGGTTLSNPIGICLVLHGLLVMPTTEQVLPFDSDGQAQTETVFNDLDILNCYVF